MTKFEEMLIDKGYIKYIFNGGIKKPNRYEIPKSHTLSSSNLNHRYFHKTDINILQKIEDGKTFGEDGITADDVKGEIIFGLNEYEKPATLVFPRPNISLRRIAQKGIAGKGWEGLPEGEIIITEDERCDDSMNIVLENFPHEEILKAMYDRSICFKVDLISNTYSVTHHGDH